MPDQERMPGGTEPEMLGGFRGRWPVQSRDSSPRVFPVCGGILEFSGLGSAVRASGASLKALAALFESVQGLVASRPVEGGMSSACLWSRQYPLAQDTGAATSLLREVGSCHSESGEQRDRRPGAQPIPCKPRPAGLALRCHSLTLGVYFASSVSFSSVQLGET